MESKRRSRAFRLKQDERLDDGLRRVAAGRAEAALERLRAVTAEDEAGFHEAVHGTRKDLKKLRAVVRLLRGRLGEEEYEEQNRRYRDAARALSASREAKVKLETLDALRERSPNLAPGILAAWREALERQREETLERVDATTVLEAIELIEVGRDGIESWQLGSGSWKTIGPGLRRTYRAGRRALRRAEADLAEESFHRWRKRAKDLWYALSILQPAWPEVLEPSADEAHRLTDLLGDHHDLAVLRADLAGREFAAAESKSVAAAIAAREEELASAAFALGRRLYAERPKAFEARLRACWRAWHRT